VSFKGIGKAMFQTFECKWPSIAGYRLARLLENGPQIVNAMAMVGMIMGPDHRIDPVDIIIDELIPQIRRCIDQNARSRAFYQDRDTASPVFRLVGITITPVIANSGHARRSPASQYRQFQSHIQRRALVKS
jgi:hypothetical protein